MSVINPRPELNLWEMPACALVRWVSNANDDHLEHIVNLDSRVRGIFGISDSGAGSKQFSLPILKDNGSLPDEKTWLAINEIILDTGYCFKKKRKTKP